MATKLKLQHKPWKQAMTTSPTPSAKLVSLYDLLINDNGYIRTTGTDVGHDIFIFNTDVYGTDGTPTQSSVDDWQQFGYDIGLVNYDKRSKPRVVTATNATSFCNKGDKFNLYDKDAALYPDDAVAVYYANEASTICGRSDIDSITMDAFTKGLLTVVGEDESTLAAGSYADIQLTDTDSIFKDTMIYEDGKSSYTKLFLNATSVRIQNIILAALANQYAGNWDTTSPYKTSLQTAVATSNILNLLETEDGVNILKYVYVWVKAPYAADYIDPKDFNQDLNQDSDVVHRNMIISSEGDFNRYADSSNTTTYRDYLTGESHNYIPKNSPLKDILSTSFYTSSGVTATDMTAIIKDADMPTSLIGSIISEPTYTSDEIKYADAVPINFFDPESRKEGDDYEFFPGRIPTIMPKYGNLNLDGRITSPTIDEIWYIIKKLISGRPLDTSVVNVKDDVLYRAAPYSVAGDTTTSVESKDTTLTDVVNSQFTFYANGGTSAIKGDPVDFYLTKSSTGDITDVTITEYFSQPNRVYHHIYNLINTYSALASKFNSARDIDTIAAKDVLGIADRGSASPDSEFGVRSSAPLSLRELEAAELGNKYNIVNNFVFMVRNFAVTGQLGYSYTSEATNALGAAGSLYQFHRDYNFNVSNPNTFFRLGGTGAALYDSGGNEVATSGTDASFQDLSTEGAADESALYMLDDNKKKTTTIKTGRLPLLKENYGISSNLREEQGLYTGAEVFLAADGSWRYIQEHLRTPILRSTY